MNEQLDMSTPEAWIGLAVVWIGIAVFGCIAGLFTRRWPETKAVSWGAGTVAFATGWLFGFVGAIAILFGWWITDRNILNRGKKAPEEPAGPQIS